MTLYQHGMYVLYPHKQNKQGTHLKFLNASEICVCLAGNEHNIKRAVWGQRGYDSFPTKSPTFNPANMLHDKMPGPMYEDQHFLLSGLLLS